MSGMHYLGGGNAFPGRDTRMEAGAYGVPPQYSRAPPPYPQQYQPPGGYAQPRRMVPGGPPSAPMLPPNYRLDPGYARVPPQLPPGQQRPPSYGGGPPPTLPRGYNYAPPAPQQAPLRPTVVSGDQLSGKAVKNLLTKNEKCILKYVQLQRTLTKCGPIPPRNLVDRMERLRLKLYKRLIRLASWMDVPAAERRNRLKQVYAPSRTIVLGKRIMQTKQEDTQSRHLSGQYSSSRYEGSRPVPSYDRRPPSRPPNGQAPPGVTQDKHRPGQWVAQLSLPAGPIFLGSYPTEQDAIAAYYRAEEELKTTGTVSAAPTAFMQSGRGGAAAANPEAKPAKPAPKKKKKKKGEDSDSEYSMSGEGEDGSSSSEDDESDADSQMGSRRRTVRRVSRPQPQQIQHHPQQMQHRPPPSMEGNPSAPPPYPMRPYYGGQPGMPQSSTMNFLTNPMMSPAMLQQQQQQHVPSAPPSNFDPYGRGGGRPGGMMDLQRAAAVHAMGGGQTGPPPTMGMPQQQQQPGGMPQSMGGMSQDMMMNMMMRGGQPGMGMQQQQQQMAAMQQQRWPPQMDGSNGGMVGGHGQLREAPQQQQQPPQQNSYEYAMQQMKQQGGGYNMPPNYGQQGRG